VDYSRKNFLVESVDRKQKTEDGFKDSSPKIDIRKSKEQLLLVKIAASFCGLLAMI